MWTLEREDELRTLWKQGWSAGEIARAFGGLFTRNAVIGKVHRLSLPGRIVVKRKPPPPRHRPQPQRKARPKIEAPPIVPEDPPEEIEPTEPVSLGLSLLDLSETTCKYPDGHWREPAKTFCGHATHNGGPYCKYHDRLTHVPLTKRQRAIGGLASVR